MNGDTCTKHVVTWPGGIVGYGGDDALNFGFDDADGTQRTRHWQWEAHMRDPRRRWARYSGHLPKHSTPAVVDDFGTLVLLS